MKFIRIFILILISIVALQAQDQPILKEKIELTYRLSPNDSVIRSRKEMHYDSLGRLIYKQVYLYNNRQPDKLHKEEKASYDPATKTLTEHIINYLPGKEPMRQKLVTRYLVYAPNEAESKYITRQLYDVSSDLVKEDTLTYDRQKRLVGKCTYDYRGNTALYCEVYDYDKNGNRSRWRTYRKWTTIDTKGEVADRQGKRRDYKYRYTKDGKLKKAWGKYYKTRFRQKIKFDKNGKKLSDRTIIKRRIKPSGSQKYRIQKDIHQFTYENGKMIEEIKSQDGIENLRTEITYQDTLVKTHKRFIKSKLSEETIWEYDENHKKIKKTQNKHNSNGVFRYSLVTIYNANEKPVREEQIMRNQTQSVLIRTYNDNGELHTQSFSTKNSQNFEKTLYIYKYY